MSRGLPFESLIQPVGYSSSTCGYCCPPPTRSQDLPRPPKTSRSYGFWANKLSPRHYQRLLDAGWRRSGCYVYKPDLARTCCKQVSIRLDVERFVLGKSAKKMLRRLVLRELIAKDDDKGTGNSKSILVGEQLWGKGKAKGKYSQPTSLQEYLDLIEGRVDQQQTQDASHQRRWQTALNARHLHPSTNGHESSLRSSPPQPPLVPPGHHLTRHLRTKLVSPRATPEKYAVFRNYQMTIHGEREDQVSDMQSFKRFLCDSPIDEKPFGSRPPTTQEEEISFGLHHLEWYLCDRSSTEEEDKLIGVSVLDILPHCISSVYFFYDPQYERSFQLGKLSALKEILFTQELKRTGGQKFQDLQYYAMGFYVHNCQKMRYKMRYRPSEILDVSTGRYVFASKILPQLDAGQAYDFEQDKFGQTYNGLPLTDDGESETSDPELSSSTSETSDGPRSPSPSDSSSSSSSSSLEDSVHLPTDPLPPGIPLEPDSLSPLSLARCFLLDSEKQDAGVTFFGQSSLFFSSSLAQEEDFGQETTQSRVESLKQCVAALGWDIANRVVFCV